MYIKSTSSDKDAYRSIACYVRFYILYITVYMFLVLIWYKQYQKWESVSVLNIKAVFSYWHLKLQQHTDPVVSGACTPNHRISGDIDLLPDSCHPITIGQTAPTAEVKTLLSKSILSVHLVIILKWGLKAHSHLNSAVTNSMCLWSLRVVGSPQWRREAL